MCPEHVNESRSGKVYCTTCNERRKAERQAKAGKHRRSRDEDALGGSSLEALTGAGVAIDVEEEELEAEARVLGKREPPQPWKLCMYSAVTALVFALILYIFPSLRRIPLGGTSYFATPYVLVIIPVIAVFWGVYGIVNIEFYKYRQRCMAGLAIAGVSILMFISQVAVDPDTKLEVQAIDLQERRQVMDEQQLEGWRENILDKYR